MAEVFLALGSNLGNRQEYLRKAQEKLQANGVHIEQVSKVMETKAQGGPPQGDFLNAVLKANTRLQPLELLQLIQQIEQELGRTRTVRNGPRTIDIDILLYDRIQLSLDNLQIPHSRMWQRDFVMIPLREIAPQLVQELAFDENCPSS